MSDTPDSCNTQDLARSLAASETGKALGLSVAKAQDLILEFVGCLAAEIAQHKTVRVHNLGNFKVLPTKERQGKNPKTGDAIKIEAGVRVHLAVSQHLKDAATNKTVPVRESRARKPAAAAAPAAPAAATPAAGKKDKTTAAPAAGKAGGFKPPAAPAAADAEEI